MTVAATGALSTRGTTECRGCGAGNLASVLDLGSQPLANEMALTATEPLETFPLHLRICPRCGLGQVGEFVRPDRIFGDDYPYLSSTSASWVQHARTYVSRFTETLGLGHDDLVVEIASNDGYLLSEFMSRGIGVLGVEPAASVARIAVAAGVPTHRAFFGAECARELVRERGKPAMVVANNVMAHVPDLHDFLAGLEVLSGSETLVTVENPSFVSLLVNAQFDTIYHEHFSYLTAHAVAAAVADHDLQLVHVDQLPTHGGSNRYWLRRAGAASPDGTVTHLLAEEVAAGLFEPSRWEAFAATSRSAIYGLATWLRERARAGATVAGYGAAAKGNTFLNAVGEPSSTIAFVVDGSPEKQGRFLPGSRIPVLAPEALRTRPVDDVLVLPWNLIGEIHPLIRDLAPAARVWVALPEMAEL